MPPVSRASLACAAQLLLSATVLLGVILAPPAEGSMLLVPIGTSPAAALTTAVDHGARLIGAGPAGTLVIVGERDRLAGPLIADGVLVTAAARGWCGA